MPLLDDELLLDPGLPPTPNSQRGQWGSPPPASPATADPIDPPMDSPGSISDDHAASAAIRHIRDHQQVDLAMLRLAFRRLLNNADDDPDPASPIRDVSCAEFNSLVSAVVRLHDDERELFGIKPLEPQPDPDRLEYEKLRRLSLPQLIDLCRREGIMPPDTCPPQP